MDGLLCLVAHRKVGYFSFQANAVTLDGNVLIHYLKILHFSLQNSKISSPKTVVFCALTWIRSNDSKNFSKTFKILKHV